MTTSTAARTIAIGDIHGCLLALNAILGAIDPQPDDVIVTLGDYVDRGPDSRGVLERLIALAGQCRAATAEDGRHPSTCTPGGLAGGSGWAATQLHLNRKGRRPSSIVRSDQVEPAPGAVGSAASGADAGDQEAVAGGAEAVG